MRLNVFGGVAAIWLATTASALPPQVSLESVVDVPWAVAADFLPDGRLVVLVKSGLIVVADPNTKPVDATIALTLTDINSEGERGLIDVAIDPNDQDGSIFVYYSPESTGRFRIARFTLVGDTIDPASEVLIWEDQPWQSCCHYGGGLDFGPDGMLYLTTGEEFDGAQAQDLTQGGGKIIRIASDGTIPADNPFADGPGGALDEIWAYGLRNPFRAKWDHPTGRFFIGEVGGNNQASAYEDIHLGTAGANFGWPDCEGDCDDPGHNDPIFTYPHDNAGASITGGFVYRGTLFPEEYEGAYFYGDYVRQWVRYLTFDDDGHVEADVEFDSFFGRVVDLVQGPDGAVYIVEYGGSGGVRRYVYVDGNQGPEIITAEADVSTGPAPLMVTFTAEAEDPEGDPIDYHWIFGDGDEAIGARVSHTYLNNGPFSATVEASDQSLTTVSDPIIISVGILPDVTIDSPPDRSLFRAGDVIEFSGNATDADGALTPDDFVWTVLFVHNEHTHPAYGPFTGTSGSFTVPTSGHDFSDDTGYRIVLDVTDADGLTARRTVTVRPDKVILTIDTSPSGQLIVVDTLPRTTPVVIDTVIGFEHTVAAPAETCDDGTLYGFAGWSDLGGSTHTVTVPARDLDVTAEYEPFDTCELPFTGGLVAWYRADLGVTATEGSLPIVAGWADFAGAADLDAIGAPVLQPAAINGRPAIRFDGIDDALKRSSVLDFPIANNDRTMFMVVNYEGDGPGGAWYGTTGCGLAFGLGTSADGFLTLPIGCPAEDIVSSERATGANWLVQSVTLADGVYRHYRDGMLIGTGKQELLTHLTSFAIGIDVDSFPNTRMDVAEVILFDHALTDQDRLAIESELQLRYFGEPCVLDADCNNNDVSDACEIAAAGTSIEFDGDDWIDIPEVALPGDFTIESWVLLEPGVTNQDGLVHNESLNQNINFYDARIRLYAPGDVIIANTPIQPTTWTHYAIVRSGANLTLYVDGNVDATGVWSGVFAPSSMGRTMAGRMRGQLDELRLWDTARTQTEIVENMSTTVPITTPGLVAYWTFNEPPADQVVHDTSGNQHHGVLGGTALAESDDPLRIGSTAPVLDDPDANGDGMLDHCLPCPADVADGDGIVGINDLLALLGAWGSDDATYDLAPPDGDGIVSIHDLLFLLGAWGPC